VYGEHGRISALRLRELLLLLGTLTGVVGAACNGVRLDAPISGRVIDAEMQKPIAGAVVRLLRQASCPRGGKLYALPALETRTDAGGHFSIRGGAGGAPCASPGWWAELSILASGYSVDSALDTDEYLTSQKSIRSGEFRLIPIRYLIEFDRYRRIAEQERRTVESDGRLAGKEEEYLGSVWRQALDHAQRLSFQPVERVGTFVSQPQAALYRVAVIQRERIIILAQDRNTGSFYAWTQRGDPVPSLLPEGLGLSLVEGEDLFKPSAPPFLSRNDGLHFPRGFSFPTAGITAETWHLIKTDFAGLRFAVRLPAHSIMTVEDGGRTVAVYLLQQMTNGGNPSAQRTESLNYVPGPRLAMSSVLPGAEPPIECMAIVGGAWNEVVFIAPTPTGRSLFVVPFHRFEQGQWSQVVARRVRLQSGTMDSEVTACRGGRETLYVALKNNGILKLQRKIIKNEGSDYVIGSATRTVAFDGPVDFGSIAVSEMGSDLEPGGRWETLYAVSGGDRIYRFDANLRADQRIQILGRD
jgi:hypothetical protein